MRKARSIPISAEVADIFKDAAEEFERIFGRPVDGEEPFMVEERYLSSARRKTYETSVVMKQAQIPPHHIYTYIKTGYIPSKDNWKRIPKIDRKAIRDSGKDFDKRSETDEPLDDILSVYDIDSTALRDIDDLAIIVGHVFSMWGRYINESEDHFIPWFFLGKLQRFLKNASTFIRSDLSYEGLSLSRNALEAVVDLHSSIESKSFRDFCLAVLKISSGKAEYVIERGKKNLGAINDLETGCRLNVRPRRQRATALPGGFSSIFEDMFGELSDFVHSSFRHARLYDFRDEVEVVNFDLCIDFYISVLLITVVCAHCLVNCPYLKPKQEIDSRHLLRRSVYQIGIAMTYFSDKLNRGFMNKIFCYIERIATVDDQASVISRVNKEIFDEIFNEPRV